MHRRSLLAGLVLVAILATCAAAAPPDPVRDLSAALRDGDLVAAREALVRWIDISPNNPRLHYNLACLDAQLEQPEAAVASLATAFRLGFDDVRRAAADLDLVTLREREDFLDLIEGTTADLTLAATQHTLHLPWGASRDVRFINQSGGSSARRTATMSIDETGLSLTISVPAGDIVAGSAPWYDGGGVILTLTSPRPEEPFDSDRAWRFGYGLRDGLATGIVLSHPERIIDQVVLDLAPVMEWNAGSGTRTLAIRLPWSHVAPYAPPADTLFGLNIEIVGPGGVRTATLVHDPAAGIKTPRARRFLPLIVEPGPNTPTSLQGRVTDTVVGDRPLAIDLTAWFPTAGHSELFTEIQDNEGNSVVTSGETAGGVDIVAGRNDWRRWADLSRLPDGPYRLLATLDLNDGTVLTWGAGLFRFGGSWLPRTRDLVKPLPEAEKPTILWRLDLVTDALVGRDPRRSPAPLITTVAETDRILSRFHSMGTILPVGGALDAYVPNPDGPGHAVVIVTPEGWTPVTPSTVVLIDGPDGLTTRLSDDGAFTGDPILVTLPNAAAGESTAVEATVIWLRALLPGCRIVLVTANPQIAGGPQAADVQVKWESGDPAVAATVRAAVSDGDQ